VLDVGTFGAKEDRCGVQATVTRRSIQELVALVVGSRYPGADFVESSTMAYSRCHTKLGKYVIVHVHHSRYKNAINFAQAY
jgi:hypothetical protein